MQSQLKSSPMTDLSYQYTLEHSEPLPEVLQELRQKTALLPEARWQITKEQGLLMGMIAKLMKARRILEIGCYTGYSTLSFAGSLAPGGKVITIDIDKDKTQLAREYFEKAGLSSKILLKIGPALEVLPQVKLEYGYESFDLAFIDADKENLLSYYENCLDLVRPNGLIIVDNVLWSGRVLNEEDQSLSTTAVREFNDEVLSDPRVEKVMLHIADGIYLLRKK